MRGLFIKLSTCLVILLLTGCGNSGSAAKTVSSLNTKEDPLQIPSIIGQARVVSQGKGLFPVALQLQDSRIAVVMRGTNTHMGIDGRLEIVLSADEGVTWSAPVIVADSPVDDRNPAFGQADDGTLVVAYWRTETYSRNASSSTWVTRSFDNGQTWTPSKKIDVSEIDWGSPFGRILTLSDGSMLMNIYGGPIQYQSYIYRSVDRGQTWQRWSESGLSDFNETALAQLPDGTLRAVMRTYGANPGTSISSSKDGRSWTQPVLVTPGGVHPADLVVLPNGEMLLTVGNRVGPYGVSGVVSSRGSFDWSRHFDLINDAINNDCGYPSSIVLKNGHVLTFYYASGSKVSPEIGVHCGVIEYQFPNIP